MTTFSRVARAAAALALAAAGCTQSSSDHTTPVTTIYYISGTVSDGVAALPGVTVRLVGSPGTVTTNASGQYRIGVTHDGSYTVAASLDGYLFTPSSRTVVVSGADVGGQDFTGAVNVATRTISGVVTGDASADVTVALDSVPAGVSKSTTTDSAGGFVFSDLADGSYLVTPSLPGGFTFFPRNSLVIVAGADVAGPDFTAIAPKHSISGTVTGEVPSGVTVDLSNTDGPVATTITDANGLYTFTGLADDSYTVTPSLASYVFLPVDQTVDVAGADVTGVDFRDGTPHAISGTVSGPVVDGVKVTLSGLSDDDITVDATGAYLFPGLIDGDYTVTPSWDGLPLVTFSPPNGPVTLAGADQTVDFLTVLVPTYTASGTVTGAVQAGVTVTLLDLVNPVDPPPTATTDAGGAWSFPGLYDSTYMVVPDLAGYLFDPASHTFILSGADVSGLDSTSSAAP